MTRFDAPRISSRSLGHALLLLVAFSVSACGANGGSKDASSDGSNAAVGVDVNGAVSAGPAASSGDAAAASGADDAATSRHLVGKWVDAEVATVTTRVLSDARRSSWVDEVLLNRTAPVTETVVRAEVRPLVLATARSENWPPAAPAAATGMDDGAAASTVNAGPVAGAPDAASADATAARSGAAAATGTGASADGTTARAGQPDASASVSAPAPAADDAAAPALNTVQTVVDDMRLMVDAPLKNVNPAYGFARGPGYVIQGNQPTGTHAPDWWRASNPSLGYDSSYWNYIIPWLVVFEGSSNTSTNVRMHFRNMKLWVKKRSTRQWVLVVGAQTLGGEVCNQDSSYYHCATVPQIRTEADGGVSVALVPGMNFHGYWSGPTSIDGSDILAVMTTLQARLITDSDQAPADADRAQFLLHTGADYYQAPRSNVLYPGVGIGRAKLMGTSWKAFNMMTFSDAGNQEPGGGITETEFRADPPALD